MEFYSASEVAKMLKVHRTMVHYWINKGMMRAVRCGNQYNISSAEIERFEESRNGNFKRT